MTILGLLIAMLGPMLVAGVGERVTKVSSGLIPHLLGLAALVAIVAGVLLMVFHFEHQGFPSLGVRPFRWQSVALGLGLAAFFVWLFAPAAYWMLACLNVGGFETGMAKNAELPVWYLVVAVVAGGIAEEVLYRGYAVERIATLTGSYWIAGAVSVLFSGIAHVPMWGWGPALTTVVSGAVFTMFFIWRRDLTANVVAHVVTDFIGLVIVPLMNRTGK